jgi:Ras-related protein Rab-35
MSLIYFNILFLFFKYYRDAAGVLIVYDVTNSESFSSVCRWVDEINRYCEDNIAKVLVGNKDDIIPIDDKPIRKVISTEDAEQYARQMNLSFFETSAKDNKNVEAPFYTVTRLALHQRLEARKKTQSSQRNDLTNGTLPSQGIQLKKSKKTDKKHSGTCCN